MQINSWSPKSIKAELKTSIAGTKTHPEQTEISAGGSCSQDAWTWLSGGNHTLTATEVLCKANLNENYEQDKVQLHK